MKVPGQPEVNIGVVGQWPESILTERLHGGRTDRHSEEIKRGISNPSRLRGHGDLQCRRTESPGPDDADVTSGWPGTFIAPAPATRPRSTSDAHDDLQVQLQDVRGTPCSRGPSSSSASRPDGMEPTPP